MTAAQRFLAGLGLVALSSGIYAWHHQNGNGPTLFDLLWHAGLLLLALALLVPRFFQATLDFLARVLQPRGKDGAP